MKLDKILKQVKKVCCCCIVLAAVNVPSCDLQAFEEATKSQLSSALNAIFGAMVERFIYNAFDLPASSF